MAAEALLEQMPTFVLVCGKERWNKRSNWEVGKIEGHQHSLKEDSSSLSFLPVVAEGIDEDVGRDIAGAHLLGTFSPVDF